MLNSALRAIVAAWLEEGMEAASVTVTELARQSGVSRQTIYGILARDRSAEDDTLRELSRVMGRPVPDLTTAAEAPSSPQAPRSPSRPSPASGTRPERAADRAQQEIFEEAQAKLLGRGLVPAEEAIGWLYRILKARSIPPPGGEGPSPPGAPA